MQLSKKEKAFCQFFLYFWNVDQILNILKKKMTQEILGLFDNTLTTDDKYYLLNRNNLAGHFCQIFSEFLKCRSNFEHFERRMTLTAYVFLKIQSTKDVVR